MIVLYCVASVCICLCVYIGYGGIPNQCAEPCNNNDTTSAPGKHKILYIPCVIIIPV